MPSFAVARKCTMLGKEREPGESLSSGDLESLDPHRIAVLKGQGFIREIGADVPADLGERLAALEETVNRLAALVQGGMQSTRPGRLPNKEA